MSRKLTEQEMIENFWDRVDKDGQIPAHCPGLENCWEWQGPKTRDGYGKLWFRRKRMGAHRAAWLIEFGAIPPNMHVLHRCDNPSCCRAKDHLFLGTQSDNNKDCARKGRTAHLTCERGPNAKLTIKQVREIRAMRAAGAKLKEIAAKFDIGTTQAGKLTRGECFKLPGMIVTNPEGLTRFDVRTEDIIALKAQGWTNRAIARRFRLHPETVGRRLKKYHEALPMAA